MSVDLPGDAYLETLDRVSGHVDALIDAGLQPSCENITGAVLEALSSLGADTSSIKSVELARRVCEDLYGQVSPRTIAGMIFRLINLKVKYSEGVHA